MSKKKYREEQRFIKYDIFGLLLFFIAMIAYRFVEQNYWSQGDGGMSAVAFVALVALIGTILYGLYSIRLTTSISKKGIKYEFFPFHSSKQRIAWDEVEKVDIVRTPTNAALSGWGVNVHSSERMYSMTGRSGVHLDLKNGEQVFIGSARPGELADFIEQVRG